MSACTKHAAEPVRGYSDCPGCEVESLRQQLAAAQAEAQELRERAEKAERNYQWMVERAADQHLSGYRELARRAADAENVADGLRAEVRELRERSAHVDREATRLAVEKDTLAQELARMREIVSGMREALEDILSRSSINLAMRPNPFTLTDMLGNIHQIADAALAQEDRNG